MDAPLVTGFDGSVAATTAVTVTKRLADGLAEALVVLAEASAMTQPREGPFHA